MVAIVPESVDGKWIMSQTKFKRGIIQSRGLGDILIALPIARSYYLQGEEIHWPVCREFYGSVVNSVPWVTWYSIETDREGRFFVETPLQIFAENGVDPDEALYLYHYLNTLPEQTDPELFNILKFDQYKYQIAGVPFIDKWTLGDCIVRNITREREFAASLNLPELYCVTSLKGSSMAVNLDVGTFLDPEVAVVDVDSNITDNIFDWLGVLEGAASIVCVDSAMANLVDLMKISGPELYWIRRSPWDLTPVLGQQWTVVPTNLPIKEPQRVDPAAEAEKKQQAIASANRPPAAANQGSGSLYSHVPFETNKSKVPTSFMSAVKQPQSKPAIPQAPTPQFKQGPNSAVNLLNALHNMR